jgi:hypothetical protein
MPLTISKNTNGFFTDSIAVQQKRRSIYSIVAIVENVLIDNNNLIYKKRRG